MEKFSSVERVVGKVSEEDKAEIVNIMENTFKNQDFKHLAEKEKKKTAEELKIIELVNDATNEIRKIYGLEKFDIPPKNIHIMKKDFWPANADDEFPGWSGWFDSIGQRIFMKEKPQHITFMKNLFHEMLHFKSYNALQVANVENSQVLPYRSGLSGAKRDFSADYLKNINEAVAEELTKKFSSNLNNDPIFVEEIRETKKSLSNHSTYIDGTPLPKNIYEDVFYAKDSKYGLIESSYTYKEEREILQLLIDKLLERNKTKFSDREEIFEMFAKGFIVGNILPIGRLIDKTFGKGTFRKIGELDKNIYEQKKFVISL